MSSGIGVPTGWNDQDIRIKAYRAALCAFVIIMVAESPANAVTCTRAVTLSGPAGFGQDVALYTYKNNDYVIGSAANGLYYSSSPSGASSFGVPQPIDASFELNHWNALAAAYGTVLAGGLGFANVYQGPPWHIAARLTIPSWAGIPQTDSFGQSVTLDEIGNTAVVCDEQYCIVFGSPGVNWEAISMFANQQVTTPIVKAGPSVSDGALSLAFGVMRTNQLNFYYDGFQSSASSMPTPPGGQTLAGVAPFQDGFLVGLTGGAHGRVQGYSNRFIKTASVNNWNFTSNSPSAPASASPNFGWKIAADAGYALVLDPGVNSGSNAAAFLYSITPGATLSAMDASFSLISAVQGSGEAIAIDGACGAMGGALAGEVTLFPVNNSPTDICCTDQQCLTVASTSNCPTSPQFVTISIPTLTHELASATVNTACTGTLIAGALFDPSISTCATVNFLASAIESPGATACFPNPSQRLNKNIYKCDTIPAGGCPAVDVNGYQVNVWTDIITKKQVACCILPSQQPVGDNICVSGLYSFSSFAMGDVKDADGDTLPDLIDNCSGVPNLSQIDSDGDLIGDVCDNCPVVPNQDQKNTTGASAGDACNCALRGVKLGPSGAACPAVTATAVPAAPPWIAASLAGFFVAAGLLMTRRRGSVGSPHP